MKKLKGEKKKMVSLPEAGVFFMVVMAIH